MSERKCDLCGDVFDYNPDTLNTYIPRYKMLPLFVMLAE
jgi:hypothetical protein